MWHKGHSGSVDRESTTVDLDTANSYIVKTDIVPEETVKVVYQARVAKIGWQKKVEDGALAGTEGKGAFY